MVINKDILYPYFILSGDYPLLLEAYNFIKYDERTSWLSFLLLDCKNDNIDLKRGDDYES